LANTACTSALQRAHQGHTFLYYLDVSLEETLRRHATRPQATEFSADDMRCWYQQADLLGFEGEHVIPESASMKQAIAHVGTTTGLTPSPIRSD
jgi:hypothetical protein